MVAKKALSVTITGFVWSLMSAGFVLTPTDVIWATEPEMEEIVVTARKREESLQEIPIAITAVSADQIRDRSLTELSQIQEVAPNVFFGETLGVSNSSRAYIRGVGENLIIYTAEQAVTMYVDGIPLTRPVGSNVNMFDAERVEVLRGPQGTTFGRNTIGGAINFITRKPSGEEGYLQLKAGNHNRLNVRAAYESSYSEDFAFRISAGRSTRDGFVENTFPGLDDLNDEDNWEARLVLDLQATDKLSFLLSADYYEVDEQTTGTHLIAADIVGFAALIDASQRGHFGFGLTEAVDGDPFEGAYTFGDSFLAGYPSTESLVTQFTGISPGESQMEMTGLYLITEYEINDQLIVKSLTSWRDTELKNWNDSLGGIWPVSGAYTFESSEEYSQELQLLGSGLAGGKLDFVAGLFWGETDATEKGDNFFLLEAVQLINFSTARNSNQETNSIAIFADANYDLSEQLGLSIGARWSEDEKDYVRREFGTVPTGTDLGGFGIAGFYAGPDNVFIRDDDWSAWSGTLGLQYQWNPDVMVYARWSRGFRSGGFSGLARSPEEVAEGYDPEKASVWEMGLRSTFLDNRVVFNITGFLTDYTDQQLVSFFSIPGPTPTDPPIAQGFRIQNAGESEIKGIEIEFSAFLTENWEISGAYGLTDAEFTKLDSALIAGSTPEADERLTPPHVPENTFNLASDYILPNVFFGGQLHFHVDYTWRDKMYFDINNSERIAQDSFGLVNARLAWQNEDESIEIALWGRNLSDKEYVVMGFDVIGLAGGFFGDPRTYGIELTKSW